MRCYKFSYNANIEHKKNFFFSYEKKITLYSNRDYNVCCVFLHRVLTRVNFFYPIFSCPHLHIPLFDMRLCLAIILRTESTLSFKIFFFLSSFASIEAIGLIESPSNWRRFGRIMRCHVRNSLIIGIFFLLSFVSFPFVGE